MMVMDYFNKLAEAETLATISAKKIKDFGLCAKIYCMPVWDPLQAHLCNGKQFDNKELREFCETLSIKKDFFTVCHPQSNGQT